MAEHLLAPASTPPQPQLMRLPNEILFAIAGALDQTSISRWMAASRFLYQLLVGSLYQRDVAEGNPVQSCSSMRWGCRTGNLDTLRRAVAAGADPRWPYAFATALDGESPLPTVEFLLNNGALPNAPAESTRDGAPATTFWPILGEILDAASQAPRWCPVPVVECFLEHGATLHTETLTGIRRARQNHAFMAEWDKVMSLPQVRGPRRKLVRKRGGFGGSSDSSLEPHGPGFADEFVLRHDHCQHAEPCNVSLTRLLLEHKADPNICRQSQPLVLRAMCEPRRPVELLRCLADAGADLSGEVHAACHPEPPESASFRWYPMPSRLAVEIPRRRDRFDSWPACPTPLHAALENAVRISSLERCPRGRNWDCYPDISYPKAADIVKFLLSRGVPIDDRTELLLDRWDRRWRRFQRRTPRNSATAG